MYLPAGAPRVPFPVGTCPSSHLLHAVVHSNGFGHLLFVGSSEHLRNERERERERENHVSAGQRGGRGSGGKSACGSLRGTRGDLSHGSHVKVDGSGSLKQRGSHQEDHALKEIIDLATAAAEGAVGAPAASIAGAAAPAVREARAAPALTAAGRGCSEAPADASATSSFVSGSQVMELWDALCSILHVR